MSNAVRAGTFFGRFGLFVGRLPWSTSRGDLVEHFQKFGKVSHTFIDYDKATGFNKGFAFVTMEDNEGYKAALRHEPHILDNKLVTVQERNSVGSGKSRNKQDMPT